MRKLLISLAMALLVALGATGSAGADGQGSGADWLAAGTGTLINYGQPMVHVNAQSDFLGASPGGHFWIRYPDGGADFGGPIVCLNVLGNEAGLVGRIENIKAVGNNPVLNVHLDYFIYISVNDNGSPGTADTVNFDPAKQSNPGCGPRFNDMTFRISRGNYVVHDQPITDTIQLDLLNQFLAQIEAAANDPYG